MSTLKRKAATNAGGDAKKVKQDGNIASFFGAPKAAPTGASRGTITDAPAPKFDKEKWAATLTPEQRELLQLEIDTLHVSWLAQLKEDIVTSEFLNLKRFLRAETKAGKKWFPPAPDVYSWSRHTPFNDIKVVIVGQDPYHNVNQAHGMAFSVRPPTPAPPSLRNMYKALAKDYPSFEPPPNKGGLLTPWADRGVLMLNTCLTVRAHEAYSHSNRGWEKLTQKIIDIISKKRTRGVVYMAWGSPAAKRVQKVDKSRHLVLYSVHPSPLSASRGFFDCGHFRKANEWLIQRYGEDAEIDWALNPDNSTKMVKKPDDKVADAEAEKDEKDGEGEDFDEDEDALNEALRLAEEQVKEEASKAEAQAEAEAEGTKPEEAVDDSKKISKTSVVEVEKVVVVEESGDVTKNEEDGDDTEKEDIDKEDQQEVEEEEEDENDENAKSSNC